ncbi:MAG: ATP synthase subunit C [Candidatus Heimdallarchaeaceae archaeon]
MLLNKKTAKFAVIIFSIAGAIMLMSTGVLAQDPPSDNFLKPIGAALAIGIAGAGAAVGMGMAGSAAIGAIVEKPDLFGKAFLFIVLIEAVAIYGLLVAILIVF